MTNAQEMDRRENRQKLAEKSACDFFLEVVDLVERERKIIKILW